MNRRAVVLSATCAVLLGATGIAVAATRGSDTTQLRVVDKRVSTTPTDETTTTATTAPELTTTTAFSNATDPGVTDTTTIAPAVEAPLAGAPDLQGTITIPSTLVAEEATPFTLTVRNIADHPVSLAPSSDSTHSVGVAIEGNAVVTAFAAYSDSEHATLAAGEPRSFTYTVTPKPESVGEATASAAILFSSYYGRLDPSVAYHLTEVPSVAVLVIPPGTTTTGPLDASLGKWRAETSADATEVAVGDRVSVHTVLTNTGDQSQITHGYGSVAVGCGDTPYTFWDSHFVGATPIAPGDSKSFDFEFVARSSYGPKMECFVGVAFGGDVNDLPPRQDFETSILTIEILSARTTTTTRPAATTTTP